MTPKLNRTQKAWTQEQYRALLANKDTQGAKPVVKYFCPWGAGTWLISTIEEVREDGDYILFGLCDLGFGCPEMGAVSLNEMIAAKGPWGLQIERDLHFTANKTLSEYADEAREIGRIAA